MAGDCPASSGCAWTNGICWAEGKAIPCNAFCNAFECDNSGACQFDTTEWMCKACDGGSCPKLAACATYTDPEKCPESKCTFAYDEAENYSSDVKGECKDKVCIGVYDATECAGLTDGCDWNAELEQCFKKGYSSPCNKIWEDAKCTSNGCSWDDENGYCSEKSSSATSCHRIYDEGDCNAKADCEYNADNYECEIKKSLEPTTPPPLTGKGDGTGNEDQSKCTASAYNAVKGKLEQAEEECIVVGRHNRHVRSTDEQQLECLAYFLAQKPNPTTVQDACPCLWFFGDEVSPWEDHWMQVKC